MVRGNARSPVAAKRIDRSSQDALELLKPMLDLTIAVEHLRDAYIARDELSRSLVAPEVNHERLVSIPTRSETSEHELRKKVLATASLAGRGWWGHDGNL